MRRTIFSSLAAIILTWITSFAVVHTHGSHDLDAAHPSCALCDVSAHLLTPETPAPIEQALTVRPVPSTVFDLTETAIIAERIIPFRATAPPTASRS